MDHEKLNRHPSARGKWPDLEPEPQPQSIHFYTCRACGQAVDKRKLGDVFHHERPDHEPIPKSRAEAFRNRAKQCREAAESTKDVRAQRDLRDLAKELDNEADKIDEEESGEQATP